MRLGNMPYCGIRPTAWSRWPWSFCDRTAGEWGAILHARSARSAPLAGVAIGPDALGGDRRPGRVDALLGPIRRSSPHAGPAATPVGPCPLLE